MSLPPLTHGCWKRLVSGGAARLKTDQLALQLLCSRMERSDAPLDKRVGEVMAFFTRFERILGREIAQLNTL
jgi:hypothetical protein